MAKRGQFAGNAVDPVIGGVPSQYDSRKFNWIGAPAVPAGELPRSRGRARISAAALKRYGDPLVIPGPDP